MIRQYFMATQRPLHHPKIWVVAHLRIDLCGTQSVHNIIVFRPLAMTRLNFDTLASSNEWKSKQYDRVLLPCAPDSDKTLRTLLLARTHNRQQRRTAMQVCMWCCPTVLPAAPSRTLHVPVSDWSFRGGRGCWNSRSERFRHPSVCPSFLPYSALLDRWFAFAVIFGKRWI